MTQLLGNLQLWSSLPAFIVYYLFYSPVAVAISLPQFTTLQERAKWAHLPIRQPLMTPN